MATQPLNTSNPTTSAWHRLALPLVTGLLVSATGAWAQQPPGKGKPDDLNWGVGLAVMSAQKAYRGMDRETRVLPLLSFENQYIKLGGPNLDIKLPGLTLSESQRLKFGLTVKLFGGSGGYDASDSPFLAGMAERKDGIWAGVKTEWENPLADVKLEWLADASGNSKGQRVVLGLERKWMLSPQLMLVPQIGAEWTDKK